MPILFKMILTAIIHFIVSLLRYTIKPPNPADSHPQPPYPGSWNSLPVGVLQFDLNHKLIFANQRATQMLNLSAEEISSELFQDSIPCEQVLSTRESVYGIPFHLIRENSRVDVSLNAAPYFNDSRQMNGYIVTLENVARHIQTEAALSASLSQLQAIIAISPIIIWSVDRDGIVTLSEGTGLEVLDLQPGEVVGQSAFELFEQYPMIVADIRRVLDGTSLIATHYLEDIILESRIDPIKDSHGVVVGATGVSINITERFLAEERLKASEQSLAQAQRIAHLGNWQWNIVTEELKWSDEIFRIFGEIPRSFQPDNDYLRAHIHPDDWQVIVQARQNTFMHDAPYQFDYRVIRPDGTLRFVHTEGVLMRAEDGTPHQIVGITQDITERRQAEAALGKSEETARRFQDKLKALHDVTIELSKSEHLDDVFRQVIELGRTKLGFDRLGLLLLNEDEDLIECTFGTDIEGKVRDERAFKQPLHNDPDAMAILASKERFGYRENVELRDDWQAVGTGWNAMALLWDGNKSIGWLAADNLIEQKPIEPYQLELLSLYATAIGHLITRKRAEVDLRHNEARLRQAMHVARLGIWEWDITTDETTWAGDMFRIYGITPESFTGKGEDYLNFTHPDDRDVQRRNIQRAFEQSAMQSESSLAGFENNPQEFRIIRPDNTQCYVMGDAVAIVDDKGNPIKMLGILTDITEQKMAEAALRTNEERFRTVTEVISDYAFSCKVHSDLTWEHEWATEESFERLTGYKWNEVGPQIYHPNDALDVVNHIEQTINGDPITGEYRLITRNAEMRWLQISRYVDRDPQSNRVIRFYGVGQDITERKEAELELRASEAKYRAMLNAIPDIMFLQSSDRRIIDFHAPEMDKLRFAPVQIANHDTVQHFPPEIMTLFNAHFDTALQTDTVQIFEFPLSHDELVQHFEARLVAFNEGSQVLTIMRDISERKQVEQQARDNEQRFMKAFQNNPSAIGISRMKDGYYVDANDAFLKILGYERHEIINHRSTELNTWISEDDRNQVVQTLSQQGRVNQIEIGFRTKQGKIGTALTSLEIFEIANEPYILSMFHDITDRKRAEDELRRRTAEFETIFEAIPDAVIFTDTEERIVMANSALSDIFSYERDQVIRQKTQMLYADPQESKRTEQLRYQFRARPERSYPYIANYQRRNNEIFPGETLNTEVRDASGKVLGYVLVIRDVTERQLSEQALIESEERFFKAFHHNPSGIMLSTMDDGTYLDVNERFLEIMGYPREDVIGKSSTELGFWLTPSHRQETINLLKQSGKIHQIEINFRTQSGVIRDALASLEIIELQGKPHVLSMFQDITERKQFEAERENLIAELAARNAEMERFTYMVSHDLKSPLITIKGFMGYLQSDIHSGDVQRIESDMSYILNAAVQMEHLLEELLELSRIGRIVNPSELVSLDELVEEALNIVAGRLAEQNIKVQVEQKLPDVYVDGPRIREVLQNLIDNAAKYMGDQPNPLIRIGAIEHDHEILCYIQDNGIGIETRYHEKIFGLFDQLDQSSEGTGIGLALVKRIIELHGGRIWVESDGIGFGSIFKFALPRQPDQG